MKKKDLDSLKQKSVNELKKRLEEEENELIKLKMELATGKLKDVHAPSKKRHDLARTKTILRQRQLAAEVISAQEVEEEEGLSQQSKTKKGKL